MLKSTSLALQKKIRRNLPWMFTKAWCVCNRDPAKQKLLAFFSRLCGFFIVPSAWNPVKNRPLHNVSFCKFLSSFAWILARINPNFDQKHCNTCFKTQNGGVKEFTIKPEKNSPKLTLCVMTSYLLLPCTPTNVKSTLSISRVSFVYSVSC